MVDHKIFI